MPFPFTLPTTSHLNFQSHLTSSTHPSLPSTATSHRGVLRSALKAHKRLPATAQPTNLPSLLSALQSYLPYLLALDAALSSRPIAGEDIDITLVHEIDVEWRSTLSSTIPGRDPPRIKGRGLDYELHSVLHTHATLCNLLARNALLTLHVTTPTTTTTMSDPTHRLATIQAATKHLITANSIHLYLLQRLHSSSYSCSSPTLLPAAATDLAEPVQTALAALSHAEATLLFVLKDDPYPALLIQSRDKNDREWMVKAPEIPRVRVGLLARLCLGAAEGVGKAVAGLKGDGGNSGGIGGGGTGGKVSAELVRYCENLRRVARAKACRFLGLEREMEGRMGEGIAWLRAGAAELGAELSGVTGGGGGGVRGGGGGGLAKLKSEWRERREDKRVEKGGAGWGLDAGKVEEGRVLEWLERKWTKVNDTVNVQLVPDWRTLVTAMPSGREALTPQVWLPEILGEEEVVRMRAPLEVGVRQLGEDEGESSDDEDGSGGGSGGGVPSRAVAEGKDPVGAFPGTRSEYRGGDESSYY